MNFWFWKNVSKMTILCRVWDVKPSLNQSVKVLHELW